MNYIYENGTINDSQFVEEEYIPITIVFNKSDFNKHIGFYYNDTDLAEFALDPKNNSINKFVLTLSSHFEFHNREIDMHSTHNGIIKLMYPSRNECSIFKVDVYSNGVGICLSDQQSLKYIRSGQLIIGLDHNDNISAIEIVDLTESNISFIKNELKLG